jgi:LmbE family N-acetylglucosaminyl deacetylase
MEALKGGSLVAIGAHADDIELHAGGIAAAWAQSGRPVHFVMTTNNMSGNLLPEGDPQGQPYALGPQQTQAIRQREQAQAAAVIGASLRHLNFPQRHYWTGQGRRALDFNAAPHDPFVASSTRPPLLIAAQKDEAIDEVADLLVSLKPAAILTQTITDIDPEHHATASLVWQAYQRRADDLRGATLYFWAPGTSSMAGMLRQNFDCIVPVSAEQFERKMRMLNCHASQMTARRLEMAQRRARYWGAEVGVEFAEPLTTVLQGGFRW